MSIHPKDDPAIKRLLNRMPDNIAASFSTEQLIGLQEAVGTRGGKAHSIDFRTTFRLPFLPFSYYLVFLVGRNKRALSEKEKGIAVLVFLICLALVSTSLVILLLLLLYMLKSALGINLFDEYSLGIWDWFNDD